MDYKVKKIHSCEDCFHWMKTSSCPREAKGQKPTINEWPCDKFLSEKEVREKEKKDG